MIRLPLRRRKQLQRLSKTEFLPSPRILPKNHVRWPRSGVFAVDGDCLRWPMLRSLICPPAHGRVRNCDHKFRSDELLRLTSAKIQLAEFSPARDAKALEHPQSQLFPP